MIRQLLCAFVIAIFSASTLFAAEWTVFHGPKGDNKSPDTGLMTEWQEGGPELLWVADFLGFGFSGVTIADGAIFTSGSVYRDGELLSMVFRLDMDGNLIWERNNGPAHRNPHPGTRGTPTIDGDRAYDVSVLGRVVCFNVETGEEIWSRNPMADYNAQKPRHFPGHSTVVIDDKLICLVGGSTTLAVALNKWTGETIWKADPVFAPLTGPAGAPIGYATPYVFDFEGTRIIGVVSSGTVEGLDAETGRTLFSVTLETPRGTNVPLPIFRDGYLFVATSYDLGAKGFRLTKNANGIITPTQVWHAQQFQGLHRGFILVGDYIYGTTDRGEWGSVNLFTGEKGHWSRPIGEPASIHYAEGLIYALSESSGTVILWEPSPTEFIERGRFELPNEAPGNSWVHPVVIGGRLFLRHAQYLYCYDVKMR